MKLCPPKLHVGAGALGRRATEALKNFIEISFEDKTELFDGVELAIKNLVFTNCTRLEHSPWKSYHGR